MQRVREKREGTQGVVVALLGGPGKQEVAARTPPGRRADAASTPPRPRRPDAAPKTLPTAGPPPPRPSL